jgi:hypothetical protein
MILKCGRFGALALDMHAIVVTDEPEVVTVYSPSTHTTALRFVFVDDFAAMQVIPWKPMLPSELEGQRTQSHIPVDVPH